MPQSAFGFFFSKAAFAAAIAASFTPGSSLLNFFQFSAASFLASAWPASSIIFFCSSYFALSFGSTGPPEFTRNANFSKSALLIPLPLSISAEFCNRAAASSPNNLLPHQLSVASSSMPANKSLNNDLISLIASSG